MMKADVGNPAADTVRESREWLAEGLRRVIVGPLADEDSAELGFTAEPLRWESAGFLNRENGKRPIGPTLAEDGEEILREPPLNAYTSGILVALRGPGDTRDAADDESVAGGADDAADESWEMLPKGKGRSRTSDTAEGADDGDSEDEETGSSATVALTVRLGDATDATLDVTLTGAWYEPVRATGLERSETFWRRHPVNIRLALDASKREDVRRGVLGAAHGKDIPDVEVGMRVRRIHGSRYCTLWACNRSRSAEFTDRNKSSLFQTRLSVSSTDGFLPITELKTSDDTAMLHADRPVYAEGHGCAASCSQGHKTAFTESLPVVELPPTSVDVDGLRLEMKVFTSVDEAADTKVRQLIEGYERWIGDAYESAMESGLYSGEYLDSRRRCQKGFLEDISAGWRFVKSDPASRKCFEAMNQAMIWQRIAVTAPVRAVDDGGAVSGTMPDFEHPTQSPQWRAFQLAFILASIPHYLRRDGKVDVIWMPTGGGKTEAYLGLAAFAILHQRHELIWRGKSSKCRGTKVLMRYTLRLLTSQQFQRASSLICALELIRRGDTGHFGTAQVSIGAWLGNAATPNTRKIAQTLLRDYATGKSKRKWFIVSSCPWCGAQLDATVRAPGSPARALSGYQWTGETVKAFCPDRECPFSAQECGGTGSGIPLYVIDEDIYDRTPDFIVSTVDKMVRAAWKPEGVRGLFGLGVVGENGPIVRKTDSPSLFIQDELHLISGPLGGLYGGLEGAFHELCAADGGSRPYVVASTATTRDYEAQVDSLYGRSARLVPPPGFSASDNFFSHKDAGGTGKMYVGYSASVGTSEDNRRYPLSVLAYLVGVMRGHGLVHDPWWTNVVFFSSRWSLAQVSSSMESKGMYDLTTIRRRTGLDSGLPSSWNQRKTSTANRIPFVRKEITATAIEDVNAALEDLGRHDEEKGVVDLCYATSTIEVGLDVSRLGLMTVMGMPKNFSQYIQVTGRVGRDTTHAPGLVFVIHNRGNCRDQSFFEDFVSNHHRLYASVESSSVTPFARKAVERWLSTYLAVMVRCLYSADDRVPYSNGYRTTFLAAHDRLREWIRRLTLRDVDAVLRSVDDVFDSLMGVEQRAGRTKWGDGRDHDDFLQSFADEKDAKDSPGPHWKALFSMRSVEGDAGFQLQERRFPDGSLPRLAGVTATSSYRDEEEW